MKALWLREVRAILDKHELIDWWKTLSELERQLDQLREQHIEILAQTNLVEFRAEFTQKNAIDTLYKAGELEDVAALLLAESAEIENKAYEAVANFEAQRIAASELYSQMGAVEHNFLSKQAQVNDLKNKLELSQDSEEKKELVRQLKRQQDAQADLDRKLREASANYERGNVRKMRLWEEVEQMWTRSLDINLSVSERRARSRLARKKAEELFRDAEKYKQEAERLSLTAQDTSQQIEELIKSIEQHRTAAKRLFGCLVGEEFLYWPRRENNKEVYCVPIASHKTGYNIELEARNLYMVSRQRGVEFIEPIPSGGNTVKTDDSRIDSFFMNSPTSPKPDEN